MALIIGDNHYIESKILSSMNILQQHVNLLKFKEMLIKKSASCQTCPQKVSSARRELDILWNAVREYLANLPDQQKAELRKVLGLRPDQRLRISYRSGHGKDTVILAKEI